MFAAVQNNIAVYRAKRKAAKKQAAHKQVAQADGPYSCSENIVVAPMLCMLFIAYI